MSQGESEERRATLVFYDDLRARTFEPFALSSPLCEMRVGALPVRERWKLALATLDATFVGAPHLANYAEPGAPSSVRDVVKRGSIVVNSRAVVQLTEYDRDADAWRLNGRLAAARVREDVPLSVFESGTISLDEIADRHGSLDRRNVGTNGVWLDEIWDVIQHLSTLLNEDIPALATALSCSALTNGTSAQGPIVTGAHPLWLEPGAVAEPFTVFDTSLGPVLLRKGAVVQSFTRVVGPCYIGRDSIVVGDRISGSAIGDTCRVHGELSASVFNGYSNKGHDGFVGHSIVGRWVNMGAGTTTSNLKNTYGSVALWTPGGVRNTGLQFLGTLFGDHAKTGIGLQLTTGCGAGANVFQNMPPKVVDPFAWGDKAPYDTYDPDKFVESAGRMMQRRHVEMNDSRRAHLLSVHAARWRA